jgi:uncharacterized phiE125 gp8 family phage protein
VPNIKVNYYETIVEPDENIQVVSIDQIRKNARIDSNDEDSILKLYRDVAIEQVEKLTNRLLRPQTIRLNAPYEEYTRYEQYPIIEIQRNPVTSINNVSAYDGTTFVVLDTEDYIIEQKAGYPRVQLYPFNYFKTWNQPLDVAYPIRVDFVAGYADGEVPASLQLAVIQWATWLYENRGDCPEEQMPIALKKLINRYRILRTFA